MNLIGIFLYALIVFGALFIAVAALVIVFLLFEDFWRRLFKMPPAQQENKNKKDQ
ncbi:MAG: hypothetical protein PHG44_00695 [Lentisphaeria bacterium]|jgi:hypothetical protein|nr:hypothetical protein [Lentisphaeria bacterium]MDY0175887.1 hypothetical protein [Lentisphaeria bacterium]NLZ59864.1 hypothetical protein [Lentisphaerota bacterium]